MERRGQINMYVCRVCGGKRATINLNAGVTPFMMECRATKGCHEFANSSFYCLPGGPVTCLLAWYRPCADEFRRLPVDQQEHVLIGGLILGDLRTARPIDDEGVDEALQSENGDAWLTFAANAYKPPTDLWSSVVRRIKGGDA